MRVGDLAWQEILSLGVLGELALRSQLTASAEIDERLAARNVSTSAGTGWFSALARSLPKSRYLSGELPGEMTAIFFGEAPPCAAIAR